MPALIELRAQEEGDLAGRLRLQGRRRAEIVVAGDDHQLRPLVEHRKARFGAFGLIGLGVGEHRLDLLAEQTARLVDLVDADQRGVLGRLVIGLHEAGCRGRKSDHDLVGSQARCTPQRARHGYGT